MRIANECRNQQRNVILDRGAIAIFLWVAIPVDSLICCLIGSCCVIQLLMYIDELVTTLFNSGMDLEFLFCLGYINCIVAQRGESDDPGL